MDYNFSFTCFSEEKQTRSEDSAQPQPDNTESESESSQRSSTGKDFEMVDPVDYETS